MKVKVWLYAALTVAAKPPLAEMVMTGSLTVTAIVAGADVPPLLVVV